MAKKLIDLRPENEEAIQKIRELKPELGSVAETIRFALGYTFVDLTSKQNSSESESLQDVVNTVRHIDRDQTAAIILLLSLMDVVQAKTASLDPLDNANMKKAKTLLEQHITRKQRGIRHGGGSSGNGSQTVNQEGTTRY